MLVNNVSVGRHLKKNGDGCSVHNINNLSDPFLGETRSIANCSRCIKGVALTPQFRAFPIFELIHSNNFLGAHSRLHILVPRCLVASCDLSKAALTTNVSMACGGSQRKTPAKQFTCTLGATFVPSAAPYTF